MVFRLEDRGQTEGARRFQIHKQVLAVLANTEPTDFGEAVYREILRMGMAKAQKVDVLQDGAPMGP